MRVGLDCGKHELVSIERVGRGQDGEHVNEAGDLTTTQPLHQEDELQGRGGKANKGQQDQSPEGTEEGEKGQQQGEELEIGNGVRLIGVRH